MIEMTDDGESSPGDPKRLIDVIADWPTET
jgi:hypothetical protein